MSPLRKLISGLEIFEKYNANTLPYPGSYINVQEEEFQDIAEKDREQLQNFAWEQTGVLAWRFNDKLARK